MKQTIGELLKNAITLKLNAAAILKECNTSKRKKTRTTLKIIIDSCEHVKENSASQFIESTQNHTDSIVPTLSISTDFSESQTNVIPSELVAPIISLCNSVSTSSSTKSLHFETVRYILSYLKRYRNQPDILFVTKRCLFLLTELLDQSLLFRNEFLKNTSHITALITSIGQFTHYMHTASTTAQQSILTNKSKLKQKVLSSLRYQLCYYYEIWYNTYHLQYPQFDIFTNYFISKYKFDLLSQNIHETIVHDEQVGRQLHINLILAKCEQLLTGNTPGGEVFEELMDVKNNLKILQNLFSILFPFHNIAPSSNNNNSSCTNGEVFTGLHSSPKARDVSTTPMMAGEENNALQSIAWEWENSDGEDVTLDNGSDDNDDVCGFKDEQTDNYDDINWEEGSVESNNSHSDQVDSSKRRRLYQQSDNNQANGISSPHIHSKSNPSDCKNESSSSAGSLINQLGCVPYAMEISFCTDVQTSDNDILLNQAREIAQALMKFSLPKLMVWIDILTQSMEHLLQLSDESSTIHHRDFKKNNNNYAADSDSNSSIKVENVSRTISCSTTEPIMFFRFTHEVTKVADLLKTTFSIQSDIQRLISQYKDLLM